MPANGATDVLNTAEVSATLQRALTMPLRERRHRWRAMMDVLHRQDITTWCRSFLDRLTA